MPQNDSEWKVIAKEFNDKWNFPNCVGTFDSKHKALQAPVNGGTKYFNYLGFFSIVLFAVVDANYNFTHANICYQGRISEGCAFSETKFEQCLEDNTMHLPSLCTLASKNNCTPFVFVKDDALPLTKNITNPYPRAQDKGSKKGISLTAQAEHVDRLRILSGYYSSVFCVLRKPMLLQPETAKRVTLAILYLYFNTFTQFLRKSRSRAIYNPNCVFDTDSSITGETGLGIWRQAPSMQGYLNIPRVPRTSTMDAQVVRYEFAEFFSSSEGMLHFQEGS